MQLADLKQVYFIGVGGIGMSAIARYFNSRGLKVSGYDKTETPLTRSLESEGITIHYGAANVALVPVSADDLLVVWTPAIPASFAELAKVQAGDYTLLKRSQVLGLISRGMDCVGIAGTHGKTTTTTITTHLMNVAGLEPSAFLGGIPRDFSSNYVHGTSDWVVVEADEYDRSFLQLDPAIAVVLSCDADHLDIYGDHANMLETGFRAYARKIREGGKLLIRYDLADHFTEIDHVTTITFGIGAGDYNAHNIRVEDGAFHFDLKEPDGHLITDIRTALPGRHNIENALAASAVTRIAGGSEAALKEGLATFKGIARRFETKLKTDKIVIIDDYAHHPTELTAAISAAKELYPDKTIRGVFQPHLFSRTQDFAAGFAQALDLLDEAILIPIYPAREEPIPGVTSRSIYGKMNSTNRRLLSDEQLLIATAELADGVLLLLGAGDIDALVPKIVAQHQNTLTHG
ncbi:UDP-N-acetylmuramate--L-alanine ligase [Neolewinella persica]|uniref:UDP-N-acetylmuramate--L-alanine ligase n=1 Tax=Neolewinella persica TaxID=70998 RepID=UPI00036A3E59|nr:UDP-N-acetylmuramate--L-alanine ligase [Neolewinella persica]